MIGLQVSVRCSSIIDHFAMVNGRQRFALAERVPHTDRMNKEVSKNNNERWIK